MTDQPLRVVVVDDEPDVRLLLRVALPQRGIDVVGEAGDGNAALEVCREHMPDAIVLDLLMPIASGFEAIPRLQAEMPGIRIVAYTAVAGEFVRSEMDRLRVPLVLKGSDVGPLIAALTANGTS
ncbi:MAG TPA: response regulator [Acidimicrobiales bacterium]